MKPTTCCLRIEFYSQTERFGSIVYRLKVTKDLSHIAGVHVTIADQET